MTEPGLTEALAGGLDPDEIVLCYSVSWEEDKRWHRVNFATAEDATAFRLTLPNRSNAYIVGTSAPRRNVHPPMVTAC